MNPVLPWESRLEALEIRCSGAFHPRHITTRLCLRILDQYRRDITQTRILDVGCGTGVLALAAIRLGARFAVGVDISRPAIELARRNAAGNAMDQVTRWVQGSADSMGDHFDWVMANIPSPILINFFEDLVRPLHSKGSILLSGFHDIELHEVQRRLEAEGLNIVEHLSGDLSFAAEPPSGSYTWTAVLATRQ